MALITRTNGYGSVFVSDNSSWLLSVLGLAPIEPNDPLKLHLEANKHGVVSPRRRSYFGFRPKPRTDWLSTLRKCFPQFLVDFNSLVFGRGPNSTCKPPVKGDEPFKLVFIRSMIFYTFSKSAFYGTELEGLVSGVRVSYLDSKTGEVEELDAGTTDAELADATDVELGKDRWISEFAVWFTPFPGGASTGPGSFLSRIRMVISGNEADESVVKELGRRTLDEVEEDWQTNIRVLKIGFQGGRVLNFMVVSFVENHTPFRELTPPADVYAVFAVKFYNFKQVKSERWRLCKAASVASVGLPPTSSLELWLSFNDSFDFTLEDSEDALEELKKLEERSEKATVEIEEDHVMLLVGRACLKTTLQDPGYFILVPTEAPTWTQEKAGTGDLAKYGCIVDLAMAAPVFRVDKAVERLPISLCDCYHFYDFTQ